MINRYDDIAKGYDELYGHEQLIKAELIINRLKIDDDAFLLDVGCGTGISTSQFSGNKFGIDPTFGLLIQNHHPKVRGIAEYLPFCDYTFDIVISLTAVHNFYDFKKGLQEIERVAKDPIIITVLRRSKSHDDICEYARDIFDMVGILKEEKDTIFFCRKKKRRSVHCRARYI
ncbi:hypothetical protein COT47_06625 [Candidatus Woesearchaeota archaeon CG08_land_8_20_14_0_20_43_7]|nr:MAG: hypothetical protein COT47_06625 [Candidatus Woesearchaeota archaeon CG08_land_8_20_14_0_20_43_7]